MATASKILSSSSPGSHLRPFDVRGDLRPVADLVEESFRETIDADGQRYLRQMREAADNPGILRWASSVMEQVSLPLWGYVWEEDGRIVGNLSLIPFTVFGKRRYLIANVAVHPAFRRRGIARELTSAAIEHARRKGAESVWLHVREENDGAVKLYQQLGFQERTRRTNWYATTLQPAATSLTSAITVRRRRDEDWRTQSTWLDRIYPDELAWHIPINQNQLQPGLLGTLQRFLNGIPVQQWSVEISGKLAGVLAVKKNFGRVDTYWLAVPSEIDETAVHALLVHARLHSSARKRCSLEFPAHQAEWAFGASEFRVHQTLIWMSIDFG